MRFTLDSNILVRAATSPRGPALRLLDIVLGGHTLVLSRFILDEVERVLLYPRIQARYRITEREAARFAGSLAEASHLVEPVITRPLVLTDPDDDPVLYTACRWRGGCSLHPQRPALRRCGGSNLLCRPGYSRYDGLGGSS